MTLETIIIITLIVVLILVSACYFFDTRKYKAGTVHSERDYKRLQDRYSDAADIYSKLLDRHAELSRTFEIKTDELSNKLTNLNKELEEKDEKIADMQNTIDIQKGTIQFFMNKEKPNDSEEV